MSYEGENAVFPYPGNYLILNIYKIQWYFFTAVRGTSVGETFPHFYLTGEVAPSSTFTMYESGNFF